MAVNDNIQFLPTVPGVFLLDKSQCENNLKAILEKIINASVKYKYPFVYAKVNVDIFTCIKPHQFSSGWLKGLICLQNDNFDYSEIGTWWCSGTIESYIGFIYNMNNVVSINYKQIAKSDIIV